MQRTTFGGDIKFKQECIPVGCVPSAAVAAGRGVSQHALGRERGVCPGGVCLGVSTQGVSAGGMSAQGVSAHGDLLDTPL